MDLLDKLNTQASDASAKGTADSKAEPSKSQSSVADVRQGDDMLNKVGKQAQDPGTPAATPGKQSADDSLAKSSSGKEEPSGSKTVKDPDSWTMDSAFEEIKKLREENKVSRLKYSEQLEKIKADQEARDAQRKAEIEEAKKAKAELEKIKAEQEDKKRNTEEKLADREERLARIQALNEAREAEYERQMAELKARLSQFEADREAENQIHQSRLQNELDKIPEQYRDHAELIVKGAGDPRDALIALNEAKLKGMFEDKTSVVNHSVPGAADGARATKERLETADSERRKSMSSQAKIKAGLDAIKSGQPNSVFRRN
jgi:chromosome segregation ATPase